MTTIFHKATILIPLLFAFLPPLPATAWGPVGHETIAYIAQDNLTDAARGAISGILRPDENLASISNWADDIQVVRKDTASWHFIELPDRKKISESQESRYCKNENCIVDQILDDEEALKDSSRVIGERNEALKFLVNLIGDVHQPLHCINDDDHNGNDKKVRYITPNKKGGGARIRLHTLWDELIETKAVEDPRELAFKLGKEITSKKKKEWEHGDPADWAWESYLIAKKEIYPDFPGGAADLTKQPLLDNYYGDMRPIVDEQLEKAGIRLAHILNKIFSTAR